MIELGTKAPDFSLKNQSDKTIKLSDYHGKLVMLSFHPLAWTSVCADQMKALEINFSKFETANTIPLGISVDSVASKKAWADTLGINKLNLLSDFWPHGGVSQEYDVFRKNDGFSERANILVNEMGQVVFAKVYPLPELPDIEEILNILGNQQFTIQ